MNRIGLFSRTSLAALRRIMDLGAEQQRVHARNLANAESPGYTRKAVRFADELDRARASTVRLETTDPRHLGPAQGEDPGLEVFDEPAEDGNPEVDVEQEVVDLAENQLRFNMAARLATLKIAGLRASIQGRS